MAITITLSLFFMLFDKWNWSFLLSIPALMVLLLTESRTAIVELVFGISLVVFYRKSRKKGIVGSILFIIILAAVLYLSLIYLSKLSFLSGVTNRMEGLISLITGKGTADHSAIIRQKYILAGIEQFKKTPLLGIGIDNSGLIAATVEGHRTYLHNNYVEILACGGIVGFIIFYSLYSKTIIGLLKDGIKDNPINAICLVMLLMMLVADYGTVSYYDKDTYFLLLIPSIQLYRQSKTNGDDQSDFKCT